MSGELTRKSQESSADEGCMGLLKTLEREEILELISHGICQHCLSLLEGRIYNLLDKKLGNVSLSNFNTEVSSEYLSLDASGLSPLQNNSEFMSKGSDMRESLSEITVQTPESVHSTWRDGHNNSNYSPASVNRKHPSFKLRDSEILLNDGLTGGSSTAMGCQKSKRSR